MKQYNFFLTYALLVLIQMVICNYFHLSAYILLSILPVVIFYLIAQKYVIPRRWPCASPS